LSLFLLGAAGVAGACAETEPAAEFANRAPDASIESGTDGAAADGADPYSRDDTGAADAASDVRPTEAGPRDARADAPRDTGPATGLDPDLELPDANGAVCSKIGAIGTGCGGGMGCRIATTDAGRCEGCVVCNGLNQGCTSSNQCDTLFQCFNGKCRGYCRLGTTECGAVEDCVDVGHDTHGVCGN
jgi:hypothetical protein